MESGSMSDLNNIGDFSFHDKESQILAHLPRKMELKASSAFSELNLHGMHCGESDRNLVTSVQLCQEC